MSDAPTPPSPPTRFDRDTAVIRVEGADAARAAFTARIDPGWWVMTGPNGGYLAAILVRALEQAVDDPTRAPRSLTIHYTAPPVAGPARIETCIERSGRSLTTLSARMLQEDHLVALALAAFSKPRREGIDLEAAPMPEVVPPHRAERIERRIEIHDRYEQRWAVGAPPFSGGERALAGGWIRLSEPRVLDAALAAAFTDAFPPALFSVLRDRTDTRGVPTIDLDIHFRSSLPRPGARPDDWTLAVFRTRVAREGFLEEDGELWSADGRLLVQSRQLALAR